MYYEDPRTLLDAGIVKVLIHFKIKVKPRRRKCGLKVMDGHPRGVKDRQKQAD